MNQLLAWFLAAGVAAACAPARAAEPKRGPLAVTCANPSSGATWQINIDFDTATVNSNPAQVSDRQISWRDPKDGGNYTLDRRSGRLTVAMASSTGGYFLYDQCSLP